MTEVNVLISTVNNRYWTLIPVEFIFFRLPVHQHFHKFERMHQARSPIFMLNKTITTNSTKSECRKVSAVDIKLRIASGVFSQIHGTEAERCLNPGLRT